MDIQYLLLLQQFREATGGIFNSFMQFLTDVGWSVLPFLVMAVIYWCIDKKTGTYLIFNCHIGSWVNGIIKMTACIYRPGVRSELIKPIETATGYSFPSGHMTNAVAIWGGLAVSKKKYPLVRNMLILLVLLIGFSRNYLGVHTPQDVIIAGIIGCLLLWGIYHLMNWVDADEKRDFYILLASILMCVSIILYASLKSYPMDYVDGKLLVDPAKMILNSWGAGGEILGLGFGWYLERRYVKFSVDGSREEKIGRILVGGLLLAMIFYMGDAFFGLVLSQDIARFCARFLMTIYVIFLHPLWFSRVECVKKSL